VARYSVSREPYYFHSVRVRFRPATRHAMSDQVGSVFHRSVCPGEKVGRINVGSRRYAARLVIFASLVRCRRQHLGEQALMPPPIPHPMHNGGATVAPSSEQP
jgi:hypothetical protein